MRKGVQGGQQRDVDKNQGGQQRGEERGSGRGEERVPGRDVERGQAGRDGAHTQQR